MKQLKTHCPNCGEMIPYNGPWRDPIKLIDYFDERNERNQQSILFMAHGMMHLGELQETSLPVINIAVRDYSGSYSIQEISGWMPAPETL